MYAGRTSLSMAAKLSSPLLLPIDELCALSAWGQLLRTIRTVERICGRFVPADPTPVVLLQGADDTLYPFLPAPDYYDTNRYCLMTPFDTYLTYNTSMQAAFGDKYNEEVAQIPFMRRDALKKYVTDRNATQEEKDSAWRAYLKEQVKNNYISHFFGEKAQRIKWWVEAYNPDLLQSLLVQEHIDHSLRVAERSDEKLHPYSIAALAVTEGAFDSWDSIRGVFAICARDSETGDIICMMQMQNVNETLVCKRIVTTHAEKYKPYSLVAMANLHAIRAFLQRSEYELLDLGTNFNTSGTYKDGFAHQTAPLKNFPTQDSLYALGQWINAQSVQPHTITTSVRTVIYES